MANGRIMWFTSLVRVPSSVSGSALLCGHQFYTIVEKWNFIQFKLYGKRKSSNCSQQSRRCLWNKSRNLACNSTRRPSVLVLEVNQHAVAWTLNLWRYDLSPGRHRSGEGWHADSKSLPRSGHTIACESRSRRRPKSHYGRWDARPQPPPLHKPGYRNVTSSDLLIAP